MKKSQNKEPWLACCYSIIIPGSGHLYASMFLKGAMYIFLCLLTQALFIYTLLVDNCPLSISVLIGVFSSIILPIYCCYSSYRSISKKTQPINKSTKNVWIALFLIIIFPPLGYLYLKKWFYAIVCFVIVVVSFLVPEFPGSTTLFVVFFCFHIALLIFKITDKKKKAFLALMTFYFIIGIVDDSIYFYCKKYLYDIGYARSGESMNPTLYAGDRTLVEIYTKENDILKAGDIVIIFPIKNEGVEEAISLFKRIVAVAGETIQVIDGVVYINGKPTDRLPPYFKGINPPHTKYYKYGMNEPYEVPEDSYFVLGDNLYNSYDSKTFGAVSEDQIKAKITKILWPINRAGVITIPSDSGKSKENK